MEQPTDNDTEERLVFFERVEALYSRGLPALLTILVNALILLVAMWGSAPPRSLLAWVGAVYGVTAVRLVLWRHHRVATREPQDAVRWARIWLVGAAVSGALWGSAALLFLPIVPMELQYLILFLVGGMVAGATASMSTYWLGFVLFAAPALGLSILGLVLLHDRAHTAAGALFAVFATAMAALAKSSGDAFVESVHLRLRNSALVERLITARERENLLEAMREADRRKDTFLATLSHELRNPLAPIRNSLYILGRAAPGGEQARRALAVVERQVGHMARLIDDLLDISRIARGKAELQREHIDLRDLTRRTVEDHRAEFVQRGIGLHLSIGATAVWVNADPTRVAQAIGNLLQNAAKFTQRGGNAYVSVVEDKGRREASVHVRDDGRGIASEALRDIFDPFTQTDTSVDRRMGGLGLGLALVKGLIELHGGAVEVVSAGIGKGSTFTITLPLASAATAYKADRRANVHVGAQRVLVIEDNTDAGESLREVLELDGHTVEVARDGPEGIGKARSFSPNVVLCDIGLPDMDGYQVARVMRADPDLGRVKLVALTGYAAPEDVARARAAGFDDHLAKPPTIEALEGVFASSDHALRSPTR